LASNSLLDLNDDFLSRLPENIRNSVMRIKTAMLEERSWYEKTRIVIDSFESLTHFLVTLLLATVSESKILYSFDYADINEISDCVRRFSLGRWVRLLSNFAARYFRAGDIETSVPEHLNEIMRCFLRNEIISALGEVARYRNDVMGHGHLQTGKEKEYKKDFERFSSIYVQVLKDLKKFIGLEFIKRPSISKAYHSVILRIDNDNQLLRLSPLMIWNDSSLLMLWETSTGNYNGEELSIDSCKYISTVTGEKIEISGQVVGREYREFSDKIDSRLFQQIVHVQWKPREIDYSKFEEDHIKRYISRSNLEEDTLKCLKENPGKIILITGEPGSGKTSFMISLASKLNAIRHYFSIARDVSKGVESMLFQAGVKISRNTYSSELLRSFLSGYRNESRLIFAIDALDESSGELRDCIPIDLLTKENCTVSYIVSARKGSREAEALRCKEAVIEINLESYERETAAVLRKFIEHSFECQGLKPEEGKVLEILSLAGNNFLFAELLSKHSTGKATTLNDAVDQYFLKWKEKAMHAINNEGLIESLLTFLAFMDEPVPLYVLDSWLTKFVIDEPERVKGVLVLCKELANVSLTNGEEAFSIFHEVFREYIKNRYTTEATNLLSHLIRIVADWKTESEMLDFQLRLLLLRKVPKMISELAIYRVPDFNRLLLQSLVKELTGGEFEKDRKKFTEFLDSPYVQDDSLISLIFLIVGYLERFGTCIYDYLAEPIRTIFLAVLRIIEDKVGIAGDYDRVIDAIKTRSAASVMNLISSSPQMKEISGLFAIKILEMYQEEAKEMLYSMARHPDQRYFKGLDRVLDELAKEAREDGRVIDAILFDSLTDPEPPRLFDWDNFLDAMVLIVDRSLNRSGETLYSDVKTYAASSGAILKKRLADLLTGDSSSFLKGIEIGTSLLEASYNSFVCEALQDIVAESKGERLYTIQMLILASGRQLSFYSDLMPCDRIEVIKEYIRNFGTEDFIRLLEYLASNGNIMIQQLLVKDFILCFEINSRNRDSRIFEQLIDKDLIIECLKQGKDSEELIREINRISTLPEILVDQLIKEKNGISFDESIEKISNQDFSVIMGVITLLKGEELQDTKLTILMKTLTKLIEKQNTREILKLLNSGISGESEQAVISLIRKRFQDMTDEICRRVEDTSFKLRYLIELVMLAIRLGLSDNIDSLFQEVVETIKKSEKVIAKKALEDLASLLENVGKRGVARDLLNVILFQSDNRDISAEVVLRLAKLGLGEEEFLNFLSEFMVLDSSLSWNLLFESIADINLQEDVKGKIVDSIMAKIRRETDINNLGRFANWFLESFSRIEEKYSRAIYSEFEMAIRSTLSSRIDLEIFESIFKCAGKIGAGFFNTEFEIVMENLPFFEPHVMYAESLLASGLKERADEESLTIAESGFDYMSEKVEDIPLYIIRLMDIVYKSDNVEFVEGMIPSDELVNFLVGAAIVYGIPYFKEVVSLFRVAFGLGVQLEEILVVVEAEKVSNRKDYPIYSLLYCSLLKVNSAEALSLFKKIKLDETPSSVVYEIFRSSLYENGSQKVFKIAIGATNRERYRLTTILSNVLFDAGDTERAIELMTSLLNSWQSVRQYLACIEIESKVLESQEVLTLGLVELVKGHEPSDFWSKANLSRLEFLAGKTQRAKGTALSCLPEDTSELSLGSAKKLGSLFVILGETDQAITLSRTLSIHEELELKMKSDREEYLDYLASEVVDSIERQHVILNYFNAIRIINNVSGSNYRTKLLIRLYSALRKKSQSSLEVKKDVFKRIFEGPLTERLSSAMEYLASILQGSVVD